VKNSHQLSLCAALFGLFSCAAEPLQLAETDSIITLESTEAEYGQFKSYFLESEIVDLCVQPGEGASAGAGGAGTAGASSLDPVNCDEPNHGNDEAIIDALQRNMQERGYVLLSESEKDNADLVLLPAYIARTNWRVNEVYCYPDQYYSGCVQPLGNDAFILPYQALLVQLIDVQASNEETLKSAWTMGLHQAVKISSLSAGTPSDGGSAGAGEIWSSAIDLAFEQSTYLQGGTK